MTKHILHSEVKDRFPDFCFYSVKGTNVVVNKKLQYAKARKKSILNTFRENYSLDTLRHVPEVKAYRDFFMTMNIDPDQEPTAVENLANLLIGRGQLPSINSVVDSCNLASLEHLVPIGVFNADTVKGNITLRFSKQGESYRPIFRDEEELSEGILVLSDEDGIISRPLYKDSQRTMITEETKNIFIFTGQASGISKEKVHQGLQSAIEIVQTSSQGEFGEIEMFTEL